MRYFKTVLSLPPENEIWQLVGIILILLLPHMHAYGIPSLGVKTLKTFHKYQVDVLGNVFPVHKETRQKFR
ncbi:hypothetical protein [Ruthenibacterium lactatiformans]|uniref:hypothetical protein n=1 Tax=Ruthenibacterium lactatiformans TaxID=1550024 RepID=UPI0015636813|nr:hypothetical protein [Ruthenibacterium lactatiformans]